MIYYNKQIANKTKKELKQAE